MMYVFDNSAPLAADRLRAPAEVHDDEDFVWRSATLWTARGQRPEIPG